VFMPILPYISDKEENIEEVIKNTSINGGKYILDGGLTLNGYCKTYFFNFLEKYDSALIEKYEKLFASEELYSQISIKIHKTVLKYCNKYSIPNYINRPIKFFLPKFKLIKKFQKSYFLKQEKFRWRAEINSRSGHIEKLLGK